MHILSPQKRGTLLSIFGLGALAALLMFPFLTAPAGQTLDGSDLIHQQFPLYSLIFDSVRDGQGLPLWNPYQFAGQSIVGNPQSTLFYPPAWLMLPLGVPRGVGWLAVLHLFWAAVGFYTFCRMIGARSPGAFVGGALYGFSSLMTAHLGAGHLNYVLCAAWVPWCTAAFLWALPRRIGAGLAGAVALGLCILTGYPPLLYFGLIWLGLLAAHVIMIRQYQWQRVVRTLLFILMGGVLLGAALLVPVGLATLRSSRTGGSLAFSGNYPLPGASLASLFFPHLFGYPGLVGNGYWGAPFFEEHTAALGLLPWVALAALIAFRQRPIAWMLAAFVVIGLLVSLGVDGGLFSLLYATLPGYSLFRVPPRALYFVTVGLAGATALFMTRLEEPSLGRRARRSLIRFGIRAVLAPAIVVGVLGSIGLTLYFSVQRVDPPWQALYSAGALMTGAFFAVVIALLLFILSRQRGHGRVWLVLLGAIALINLWAASAPLVGVSAVDVPDPWRTLATVAAGSPAFRVATQPVYLPWQATAAYTRHLNANGYDPLIADATARLMDAANGNPNSPIYALLGVRYIVSNTEQPALGSAPIRQGDWWIYENKQALPRAFVASQTASLGVTEIYTALASGAYDLRTVALLGSGQTCNSAQPVPGVLPQGTSDPARIVRYTPNTVDIDVMTRSGILILTDSFDPDWRVTIDGISAPLLTVDGALRGVCLPGTANQYQVALTYVPLGFYAGLVISALSWIVVGLYALWVLIRMRRGPAIQSTGRWLSFRWLADVAHGTHA